MDPKKKRCLHPAYRFETKATRLVDQGEEAAAVAPMSISVELKAWCADCNEPLRWMGMVKGYLRGTATVSADGFTARLSARVNPLDVCPFDCIDGVIYLVAGSSNAVIQGPCPHHFKAPTEPQ